MTALCFRPKHNTPGKKDVTGAFAPELARFMKTRPAKEFVIDNSKTFLQMRNDVLSFLAGAAGTSTYAPVDSIAFFCHGWQQGIQLGFRNQNVPGLAKAIFDCVSVSPTVALYCCSTGGDPKTKATSPGTGDGSFADLLRDKLCQIGLEQNRVTGHDRVGHATKLPYVKFFDGMGSAVGGAGGFYPVAPGSKLWPKWRKALRETDLRFKFPFMQIDEIHAELG
jgi:hypothetical protein